VRKRKRENEKYDRKIRKGKGKKERKRYWKDR
jgi:hypothetical protein